MVDRRIFLAGALSSAAMSCDTPTAPAPAADRARSSRFVRPTSTTSQAEADRYRCPAELAAEPPSRIIDINEIKGPSWAALSPNGRILLVQEGKDILFASTSENRVTTIPLPGPRFGIVDAEQSLAWSSGSNGVWLLTGETSTAGWVTGPLHCARLLTNGRIVRAPALRRLPGRLDQVAWVDGRGLGIAYLDTRGGYNRPERVDQAPTLAIVQAARGSVRSVLPLRTAITAAFGQGEGSIFAKVLATVVLRDGRVRALLRCGFAGRGPDRRIGGAAIWTEGAPLKPITLPADVHSHQVVFTPDGLRILVSHPLSASGPIYERHPSPPPVPTTGLYAALYDLDGKAMWRLEGTATEHNSPGPPAVSNDGRTGLVVMPQSCGSSQVWAVLNLRSGSIQRRLVMNSSNRAFSVGFDDTTPWMASYHQLRYFS